MKRFTETTKWQAAWFRRLPARLKCFWMWICDACDSAGVCNVDFELASFQIGEAVSASDLTHFEGRLLTMDEGNIHVATFVRFQYGELSPACAAHRSILKTLDRHGLRNGVENEWGFDGVPMGSKPHKETDKEKDKEKDKTARESKPLPECEEFVSYLAPFLADLGDPVPLAGWLAEQFVYYSSNVWPKGQYLEWKAFRHSFPQKYRSRHAEIKAKFPAIPKAASKGIKETPMDKLLRENEEMFADGVHPDKWRAANPGKDYIKCKP